MKLAGYSTDFKTVIKCIPLMLRSFLLSSWYLFIVCAVSSIKRPCQISVHLGRKNGSSHYMGRTDFQDSVRCSPPLAVLTQFKSFKKERLQFPKRVGSNFEIAIKVRRKSPCWHCINSQRIRIQHWTDVLKDEKRKNSRSAWHLHKFRLPNLGIPYSQIQIAVYHKPEKELSQWWWYVNCCIFLRAVLLAFGKTAFWRRQILIGH